MTDFLVAHQLFTIYLAGALAVLAWAATRLALASRTAANRARRDRTWRELASENPDIDVRPRLLVVSVLLVAAGWPVILPMLAIVRAYDKRDETS